MTKLILKQISVDRWEEVRDQLQAAGALDYYNTYMVGDSLRFVIDVDLADPFVKKLVRDVTEIEGR